MGARGPQPQYKSSSERQKAYRERHKVRSKDPLNMALDSVFSIIETEHGTSELNMFTLTDYEYFYQNTLNRIQDRWTDETKYLHLVMAAVLEKLIYDYLEGV